jgi:hypothetical protein
MTRTDTFWPRLRVTCTTAARWSASCQIQPNWLHGNHILLLRCSDLDELSRLSDYYHSKGFCPKDKVVWYLICKGLARLVKVSILLTPCPVHMN